MNLRDLEYVAAVAKLGSFSGAADACHVSQPALSNQIRKLEKELGMDLFIRASGDTRLTAFGERVVAVAQEMLAGA
ncbi:MAG: LysR family transcriptional regulator, partial [Pseudomonadota bacterium]